jgi:predicted amidophosphoribosyltransferase
MKTTKATTTTMKTDRCRQCPATVEPGDDLCPPCSVELAHRVMNAEPDPQTLRCAACKAPFSLIEARVLRQAKNPTAGDHQTPTLCWVCARLHLSATLPDPSDPPPGMFQV